MRDFKIPKKVFNKIFSTYKKKQTSTFFNPDTRDWEYSTEYVKFFYGVTFYEGVIYLNCYSQIFKASFLEIGFLECEGRIEGNYKLEISPQYIESVNNLFDLILSSNTSNKELAYQIFQNIREYSKI